MYSCVNITLDMPVKVIVGNSKYIVSYCFVTFHVISLYDFL